MLVKSDHKISERGMKQSELKNKINNWLKQYLDSDNSRIKAVEILSSEIIVIKYVNGKSISITVNKETPF